MTLKECIEKIIENFDTGDYFDSHTIINELTKNPQYHIIYLREFSSNCNINQYHGKIGRTIATLDCVKESGISKSHTIYGEISKNESWQKNK